MEEEDRNSDPHSRSERTMEVATEEVPLKGFLVENVSSKSSFAKIRASRRPFYDKYNDSRKNISTMNLVYPSGLDFERVVNNFSIEASRDRYLAPMGCSSNDSRKDGQEGAIPESIPLAENEEYAQARYDAIEDSPTDLSTRTPVLGAPSQSTRKKKPPFPWGYTGRTATGWFFCVLTGLLTATIAIFLAYQSE